MGTKKEEAQNQMSEPITKTNSSGMVSHIRHGVMNGKKVVVVVMEIDSKNFYNSQKKSVMGNAFCNLENGIMVSANVMGPLVQGLKSKPVPEAKAVSKVNNTNDLMSLLG